MSTETHTMATGSSQNERVAIMLVLKLKPAGRLICHHAATIYLCMSIQRSDPSGGLSVDFASCGEA
jgi:hypothetical protein